MKGKFIVFEGLDGCGKTTQLELTRQWLESLGVNVLTTREPGGTPLGEEIRSLLKQGTYDPITELLLYNASRRENIIQVIQPHLDKGGVVLCDRFYYSTIAYQGYGQGLNIEYISELDIKISGKLDSDLVIWIDIDPTTAIERITKRGGESLQSEDKLEFLHRVRKGYEYALYPVNFSRINGLQNPEEIQGEIRDLVQKQFPGIFKAKISVH